MLKEINCQKLKEKIEKEEIILFDVREPFEYQMGNLGGKNLPVSEIQTRFSEIPQDKEVVLYCRSGSRSSMVINFLQENFGYKNLINLSGGIINC
jgi:adenylyltransferase/sulfurtransferase